MAPETRGGVKRKQATTEEETTATKSKTQTRVAKGKQPTNKEETAATKFKTQAVGEAAKGNGKRTVAAMGKGKRTVAAKGKGKGTVSAKGKGKTTQEKPGSPNSPFNPASHSHISSSDSTVDEDYYDSDDDHYDSPLDNEFPSKGQVMEATRKKIYTIKSKGVGDAAYIALIVELKRLLKSEDTVSPEEVYQAAVDLISKEIHPLKKKKRVTVTEKKVTQLVHKYVNLRLTELAVVIVELQSMKDWDMEVAIFVKDLADKYLKLLKLKRPNLEKLYDTADEVTKLKESSELFPGAIDILQIYGYRWFWDRFDDYDPKMRGKYDLEHIC